MSDEELEVVYENVALVNTSTIQESDSTESSISPSILTNYKNPRGVSIDEAHKIKLDTKCYLKNRLKIMKKGKERNTNIRKQSEQESCLNFKVVKYGDGATKGRNSPADRSGNKMSPVTPIKENENKLIATNHFSKSFSAEQNIRLSPHVSKRPKKFSINGSPANSKNNKKYFSRGGKESVRSVNDTSPLTFMRSKFPLRNSPVAVDSSPSPDKKGVKRKLNFSSDSSLSSQRLETNSFSSARNSLDNELGSAANIFETPPLHDEGYLLRQFKIHIDIVLSDNKSQSLINEEEMDTIRSFFSMNCDSRDLYARMHNRIYKWHRLSDIRYNLATLENLDVLKDKGFISTDTQDVETRSLLNLLKTPEMKDLSKSLGLKINIKNKQNYCEEILQYCQKQRTIGFTLQIESSESAVRRRIYDLLGPCFILCPEPRGLFRRIHLLFNLKFNRNEQSAYGSQDLFEIQYAGTNKSMYPNYNIDKTADIFSSREEFLRFQTAEDLRQEFTVAVGAKNLVKADTILSIVRNNFIDIQFGESPSVSAELPLCLRKYTAGTVYAYILYDGVDVLKKVKKIEQAINDLLLLLDQCTYLPYMRGKWYEKIISIQRTAGHMKEIAKTINDAVNDAHVDDYCRYAMSACIRQMLKKKKGVLLEVKRSLEEVPQFPPLECVEPITINACALDGKSGYKRVYIQDDSGDGKTYSSVEELVKSHYCPRQFKYGMHSENILASSLFGILFWDIIYECDVPNVFISPYQARPFDLSTGEFYKNREFAIDTKLYEMANWTTDKLSSWVKEVYDKQKGKVSVVNWKCFYSSDHFVDIISCIGLEIVLKICERYAKNYRFVRSGFPDLFLWTPGQKDKYKFVEVKGPKDTLGINQKLWLDFLVKINANVEVCLVKALGAKTLRSTLDSNVLPECNIDEQNKVDVTEDHNIV